MATTMLNVMEVLNKEEREVIGYFQTLDAGAQQFILRAAKGLARRRERLNELMQAGLTECDAKNAYNLERDQRVQEMFAAA